MPSRMFPARLILAAALVATVGCKNRNYVLEACPVRPLLGTSAASARQASDLRVMTLNMWGINYVSADIDARFDALADRLSSDDGIDVVGFEEVWADAPRQRLLEKLKPRFPHQADFQTEYGRSGLAIVSRHAFSGAPRFIPFPQTGKWWKPWTGEWFGGKGIGAADLQAPGGAVWFFVTHLHACYEKSEGACDADDEYGVYRGHQLETLRAAVNEIAGDEPALIVGDFNFTKASKYYLALTTKGVFPPDSFDPAWQRIDEPAAPARRIDYIWVRPGRSGTWTASEEARAVFGEPVRGSNGTEVPLSDHCAMAATLRRSG